jgi:hypothetical protein
MNWLSQRSRLHPYPVKVEELKSGRVIWLKERAIMPESADGHALIRALDLGLRGRLRISVYDDDRETLLMERVANE